MSSSTDSSLPHIPKGYNIIVRNVGVKDATKDFVCIFSDSVCTAAGVFTQSRFAGPSVLLSRKHLADGRARAIIAISKNANVANGPKGEADAENVAAGVAEALGFSSDEVLIASTGVIGRPYPMARIMPHVEKLAEYPAETSTASGFISAAQGIMTTDTVPKYACVKVGDASIVGIAKGVGMIEPNMATLLTFFFTNAEIDAQTLDAVFRRVMDKTFNCVSVDTDTSTSDTATILANGQAGPVDTDAFETGLQEIAQYLTKEIARDGEGATKLIEVTVDQARNYRQAKRVAKAIVNSPLVKTAVHGADANWGRVAMAVGKCEDELDITEEKTIIRFGGVEVYPHQLPEAELAKVEKILTQDEVAIHVSLQTGTAQATVWGCDLSAEYVRINGEYTT